MGAPRCSDSLSGRRVVRLPDHTELEQNWNAGIPETGHFEYGQERMEVPLWQDPEAYISDSPVLLVYRGENHSNRGKANQIDYRHRQLEWFNYYLKGEEPAPWITEGVSWIEQEANRASK